VPSSVTILLLVLDQETEEEDTMISRNVWNETQPKISELISSFFESSPGPLFLHRLSTLSTEYTLMANVLLSKTGKMELNSSGAEFSQ
jgi:hypothetical protein